MALPKLCLTLGAYTPSGNVPLRVPPRAGNTMAVSPKIFIEGGPSEWQRHNAPTWKKKLHEEGMVTAGPTPAPEATALKPRVTPQTAGTTPQASRHTPMKKTLIAPILMALALMPLAACSDAPKSAHGATFKDAYNLSYSKHYEAALALLKPLAEQGDLRAMGLLGSYYENGIAVPVDHARAASLWRSELASASPRAMAGDADAQDALAEMYINGWGVTPDPANMAKAVELFRKAAEDGNADAQSSRTTAIVVRIVFRIVVFMSSSSDIRASRLPGRFAKPSG